jgi:hypothetical protein
MLLKNQTIKLTVMKKATILFSLFLFATASFCQQETTKAEVTNVDFLKKSKRQKTFAWVLTATGTTVLVLNVLVSPYTNAITGIAGTHSVNTIPYILGGALVTGGVILFVAASKNKRKADAATAFFRMENIPVFQNTVFSNRSLPVLGFKISL